jgi:hypothetical protein
VASSGTITSLTGAGRPCLRALRRITPFRMSHSSGLPASRSPIQFSELFKLHAERADGLRWDMSAYVRGIAKVKEGQKDGTFSTYHPRRKCTCDSSRGGRRWRRRRLAEAYAAAARSTASKVAALCSAW